MKLPRRITLIERRFGKERAHGMAHYPSTIEIDPTQKSRERLDTVIHEGLHLLLPEAQEMMIRAYANRLSDLLWRDGWRRVRE